MWHEDVNTYICKKKLHTCIVIIITFYNSSLLFHCGSKFGGLEGFGLTIDGREPIHVPIHPEAEEYLKTKRDRMGHLIPDELDHIEYES